MVQISTNKKQRTAGTSPFKTGRNDGGRPVRLVHISDLHTACARGVTPSLLLNKRILGFLRWRVSRSREYDQEILALLRRELEGLQADKIIIAGDLTHLGLPAEFQKISIWLKELGPPGKVIPVPGNHDTYTSSSWQESFSFLEEYLLEGSVYSKALPPPRIDRLFPLVFLAGDVAIIGISTARPCAWHLATGTIGNSQLERLESVLSETGKAGLFRVLALHHPPIPGVVKRRKGLTDAPALQAVLKRLGCGLVLHGHSHRTSVYSMDGPLGKIPVIEAPSALSVSTIARRRARYFVYDIKRDRDQGWKCLITERLLDPAGTGFQDEGVREYYLPG